MTPELVIIFCRVLRATAAMALWGGCGYLATLVPAALAGEIAARLRMFQLAALAIAVAASWALLPLQSAALMEEWSAACDPAVWRDVLTGTGIGTAWLWQAGAAAALLASQTMPSRLRMSATAIGAGLLLASLATGGHAVMRAGAVGLAFRAPLTLHLLGAGAWFGALVPVLLIMRQPDAPSPAAIEGLRAFSRAGHMAVALTLASGLAGSLLILGWPIHTASLYAGLLLAKVVAAMLMTLLAIFNRYVLVPRLGTDGAAALAGIRRNMLVSILLGLVAIVLVGVFGTLDPGG